MTSVELKNKILALGLDPTGKSVKQQYGNIVICV